MSDDGRSRRIIHLDEGWYNEIKPKAIDKLESMLNGGLQKRHLFGPKEYMPIYTTCFNMCNQHPPYNWSRELYQRHGETIDNYLIHNVIGVLKEKASRGGTILLGELQHRWSNHQIMNKWLKLFFTFLDRFYVKNQKLPTLSEAGLRSFRTHVFDVIKGESSAALLALINSEREGSIIDKSLVKSIVELYEAMGMGHLDTYNNDLEVPLLENTREFYSNQRDRWINNDSTPEYLIKAEAAMAEERARVLDYLNHASEKKILRVLEEEILEKVQSTLLEKESSGCRALLQNDKSEDLQRMFCLFQPLQKGLQPMAQIAQDFITNMGTDIVNRRQARLDGGEKDKNDDPTFVKALIELHEKYLAVVRKDFAGHNLFQKALKDTFVEIVNSNVGNFTNAELLSTYCDRILVSGERLSEAEVEESLDRIVQLFSYLTDKDLFAEIYRNQLAKRLLTQRSTSHENEKMMIAKLKVQCGTQFTSKMEGMLANLTVGAEHRQEFGQRMAHVQTKLDFSVQVLTTGYWPTYKSPEVPLTDEMKKCLDVFKDWHDQKHQKRKLTWVVTQGNATVRGIFGNKSYDLQVSTLQAVALDALSGGQSLTFEELGQRLNLEDSILKPLMHSLSCGKHKVVSKTPMSNKISRTDSFKANPKFTSNMRKIRIPMASLESSFNTKKVEEDRTIAIEAAIVRIMKARKRLSHQQLLAEVLQQLNFFNPSTRIVKKRIEALINREYLERSMDDNQVYNYLA